MLLFDIVDLNLFGAPVARVVRGVPAAIGGRLILSGTWNGKGVYNMEQNDPDPFMEALNQYGLPWSCVEL